MGLFKITKKEKSIQLTDKDGTSVIINKRLKSNKFFIGDDLKVPNGYVFFIGKNGKALDFFTEGEYTLMHSNLPKCCQKLKIGKLQNGELLKDFEADAYYINQSQQTLKFESYRKIIVGDKHNGVLKFDINGSIDYKISSNKEFLQSLLNEYAYIKTGEAEKILSNWVEEVVVSCLEKYNYSMNDILTNNPKIKERLKLDLDRLFSVAGLEILNLTINKFIVPKKYQQQIDDLLNKENFKNNDNINMQGNKDDDNCNQSSSEDFTSKQQEKYIEHQSIEDSSVDIEEPDLQSEKIETNIEDKRVQNEQTTYVPFGGFNIDNCSFKNNNNVSPNSENNNFGLGHKSDKNKTNKFEENAINQAESSQNLDNEETNNNSELSETSYAQSENSENNTNENQNLQTKQNNEYVDLNLDKLYNNNYTPKVCKYCGELNDNDSVFCKMCGVKLN